MFCFGKIFLKAPFFTQTLRESRFHVQTFLLLLHSSFTLSLELTHLLYHIFIALMRIVFDGEIFYLCRNTIFHHTMLITEIFVCFDCALYAEANVGIGLNLSLSLFCNQHLHQQCLVWCVSLHMFEVQEVLASLSHLS